MSFVKAKLSLLQIYKWHFEVFSCKTASIELRGAMMGFPQIIIALSFSLNLAQSLTTYQSLLPLTQGNSSAGLKLKKSSVLKATNFSEGISFCGRWNYRHLDSILFATEEPQFLTKLWIAEDESYFYFGSMNRIVTNGDVNDPFRIWITNQWHHLCVSFDRKSSRLVLIKVT